VIVKVFEAEMFRHSSIEFSGVIDKIGEEADSKWKVGDRVCM